MKKKNIFVPVIVLISLLMAIGSVTCNSEDKEELGTNEDNVFQKESYIPPEGFVANEETAIQIAEAIWYPIYGESIYEKKPFFAILDEEKKCWLVQGTLSEESVGGVPYISISKVSGEILFVNHSK